MGGGTLNRFPKRGVVVGILHIDSVSVNCLRVLDRPNRTDLFGHVSRPHLTQTSMGLTCEPPM